MRVIQQIALALVIIGAVNWGLIGFFQFDLVVAIFGGQNAGLSRVIYVLVGLSGLICISLYFNEAIGNDNADHPHHIDSKNLHYGTEFAEDENDDINR